MGKPCQQVVIPSTDNTEIECENFQNSKCVQIIDLPNDLNIYFGLDITPTLNEFLVELARKVISNSQRVSTIENNQ